MHETAEGTVAASGGEDPGRSGLSARAAGHALAIARAALPAGERVPAPDAGMVRRLAAYLAAAPPLIAFGYRSLLHLFAAYALLRTGRRLGRLSPERVLRLLEHGATGRRWVRRMILRAILTPLKIAHYADPAISRTLGYDPPPAPRPAPPPPAFARMHDAASRAGETLRCDVAVVGTGPGGAVMATRLAERGLAVILLEEGGYLGRADFTRRPFEMMARAYRDVGLTVALGVPGVPIPLGRTVGGTSTINSGTCFRVPDRVLARWQAEHGLAGWTRERLAPHYADLEAFLEVAPVAPEVVGRVGELVARGADALGWSHGPLHRNADGCEGSGVCAFGCPTGAKRSMNVSFVPRALAAGAELYTGARVRTILREGRRAAGVVAETAGGETLTVRADAVVVSAGALLTPGLLRRNGLGRRATGLGRHLTVHPATKVAALFDDPVRGWEGVPQGYCIDEFAEEGIVFEGASLPPEMGSVGFPHLGPRFTALMERYDRMAFFGFLIEDDGSRGRVTAGPPGTEIRYHLGRAELDRLKRGTRLLSEMFFAAGARAVYPPVAGIEELSGPDALGRLDAPTIRAQDFELTAFHPLGTCRMGPSPDRSVLDPGLETWEIDGLFVADGSIFPSSLGVNPQMTIMAASSVAAEHVAARVGGAPRLTV